MNPTNFTELPFLELFSTEKETAIKNQILLNVSLRLFEATNIKIVISFIAVLL